MQHTSAEFDQSVTVFFNSSADGERPFTVCNCTIKEWKKVYIWPLKNRSDDMDHHRIAWYESLILCHWNLQSYTDTPGCNPSDLIIHFFIIISIVFLAPCCIHSHCFGLNMLVTPFPLHHESLPTLLPGSLLEAIWVRHRHCWLKRGFFCHPLREEHWDKRWDETDHKHSSINRLLPQKRPVVRLLFFWGGERMWNFSYPAAVMDTATSLILKTKSHTDTPLTFHTCNCPF